MLLGIIADDFTGASDLANTLAREGMRVTQFVGTPKTPAPKDCEAGVVAMKTRSIPAAEAVRLSLEACDWLLAQGCTQILFKYCSTFDSTPEGNIGPVTEALMARLGAKVAVVCPAFPTTGRRVFMGHLFVGEKLLNESGMQNHPLNPMTDANLQRWLALQCKGAVGLITHPVIKQGEAALAKAFDALSGPVVCDAVEDSDLRVLGLAMAEHKLITGGSGIALGLPENFRRKGLLAGTSDQGTRPRGPAVALSGSCSIMSNAQVARHLQDHPGWGLDPDRLMAGEQTPAEALAFALAHRDQLPIIHSTAAPEAVARAQSTHGREAVAARIEGFFAELARGLAEAGFSRIVVGGGETSGAVVEALDLDHFAIGPEIDPGVPALSTSRHGQPLGLALKSGNFGAEDFFARAATLIGDEA